MIDYKNKINLKEQEYFMFVPISHERIDLLINTTHYDIIYDDIGQDIQAIQLKKDNSPIIKLGQELSVIMDEQQCYCIKVENILVDSVNKNMTFLFLKAKKKNVSYLFLLPLCDIANKVKMLPISDVYTVSDNPLCIVLKIYKPFLKNIEDIGFDIIKNDDEYIYIKTTLDIEYIADIDLIYEGRYSILSDKAKDMIYNYHLTVYIPRSEHMLYHIFNRTKIRRDMLSKELGVEIHPLQELYSKITKEEEYVL